MNGICSVCGEPRFTLEHHTSYIPEKKINVCASCHKKLHATNPELKPPEGFYQKNKISFCISDEIQARVDALPRKTKLSERLRIALAQILDEVEAQA